MWWMYVIFWVPFYLASKSKKYKLKVYGRENIPRRGPVIVIPNHQTGIDFFVVALGLLGLLPYCKMLPWAKKEIGEGEEGPLGRILWRLSDKVEINRDITNLEGPIKKSQDSLRKGDVIFIHPEGTRYKYGELGPFSWGAADLIRSMYPALIPILPVAVYRRMETDGGITVVIGKPFILPKSSGDIFLEKYEGQLIRSSDRIKRAYEEYVIELAKWSESIPVDKKSMRILTRFVKKIIEELDKKNFDFFKEACRLADKKDTEYIRDKVFELLPHGWKKV